MSFADCLYFLLPSAFKRTVKKLNGFWILFKVLGRHIGEAKSMILDVREQSMILTCPPELLPIFGEEYGMPRLKGESDSYRNRLTMKADIAKMAGTKQGIILTLASLGYERSYIEPLYKLDPDRWAEFIIFLRGSKPNSINDLRIIDSEIMRVKQASSKPAYGSEKTNRISAYSAAPAHDVYMPLCGVTLCGEWPEPASYGVSENSQITISSDVKGVTFEYPMTGSTQTSEMCYQESPASGIDAASLITIQSAAAQAEIPYPMTGETITSEEVYISVEE